MNNKRCYFAVLDGCTFSINGRKTLFPVSTKVCLSCGVVDPHPDRILIQWGSWIRILEVKNGSQKKEKVSTFSFFEVLDVLF
jgi:hypothetical protein